MNVFQYYSIEFTVLSPMKIDSDMSEREVVTQNEQQSAASSRQENRFQFTQQKSKRIMPQIGNRLTVQQANRMSSYSSVSKLTSYIKQTENDNFKQNDSYYFNQLTQKYGVPRGQPTEKVRQEMQQRLKGKTDDIEGLIVHRDELKFISYNNPNDNPIKISLALLKEKATTQQKVRDMTDLLRRNTRFLQKEQTELTAYHDYLSNLMKNTEEKDLIIDTQEQQKLMIVNLQKENTHLFKELKEIDKKNAKQIKNIQESIALLRIQIKQKEDTIRDLKSKICFLHIKLHSRSANSREKNMSLSIRKFITDNNRAVQQAFIGNRSFKSYSKEIIQKITNTAQLVKLQFFYEQARDLLTFRCIYRNSEGLLHELNEEIYDQNHDVAPKDKQKKQKLKTIEIRVKYLLSFKFYFKSRVVGVECRVKSDRGTENIQIGNCSTKLQHELLTLINKRIVTLGSYWHQKEMIGVGVWCCSKSDSRNNSIDSRKGDIAQLRTVKSAQALSPQRNLNKDYYS